MQVNQFKNIQASGSITSNVTGIDLLKEQTEALTEELKKSDEKIQETSFKNPTVEEIKQLQAEPKNLQDKKLE